MSEPPEDWRGFCLDLALLLVAVDAILIEAWLLTH